MKTIDVKAKEWFDKINGNSYFSAQITIDFGHKTEQTFYLPYQYGYGDHYLDIAKQKLVKLKKFRLKSDESKYSALWSICQTRKIKLRYSKQENCLKRDMVAFGFE